LPFANLETDFIPQPGDPDPPSLASNLGEAFFGPTHPAFFTGQTLDRRAKVLPRNPTCADDESTPRR
jgi:hypothetical protein